MTELGRAGGSRTTDPGWWPAVRKINPFGLVFMSRLSTTKNTELSGVTVIRSLYLTLLLAGLLIGLVLMLVVPIKFDPVPLPIVVIVTMGITSQVLRMIMTEKTFVPESFSSSDALADAWRRSFFLGFALTDSTLLIGFVFCFVEDAIWPYVLALPFFLYGMLAIAPSKANLQRLQERVTAQGQMTSVIEALNQPMQVGRER